MYALRSQDKLQPSPKDARLVFRRRQPSVVQVLRVLRADTGKLAQRARKMRPQVFLGLVGFAARYRFRDQLVMADDVLRLAGGGQVQTAQAVDMTAAAAYQCPDVLLVGGFIELGMELVVGGHEFLERAGLQDLQLPRDGRVELGNQRLIRLQRQHAHDLQFQRLAQEMRLLRAVYVDPADDRRILREHLDQSFLVEAHQCIADRRRGYAELFRQRRARQRRARRQLQRDDHAAQPFEDLRRRLAVAIKPPARTGGDTATGDDGLIH